MRYDSGELTVLIVVIDVIAGFMVAGVQLPGRKLDAFYDLLRVLTPFPNSPARGTCNKQAAVRHRLDPQFPLPAGPQKSTGQRMAHKVFGTDKPVVAVGEGDGGEAVSFLGRA